MGIRDEYIEMTGTPLQRALQEMKDGHGAYIINVGGEWKHSSSRATHGSGPYYERMPDGEVRLWSNRTADDTSYDRVYEGKRPTRR